MHTCTCTHMHVYRSCVWSWSVCRVCGRGQVRSCHGLFVYFYLFGFSLLPCVCLLLFYCSFVVRGKEAELANTVARNSILTKACAEQV